jgi:hypothetical protein
VLATGGYDIYFAGLRSGTFIDGRGTVVIFGPADIAAGAKIFTHGYIRSDPNVPTYSQGRFLSPCVIYPDCALGEDAHIFGSMHVKTILADTSVTVLKKSFPPYSVIGGIGRAFRVIRYLDFPETFPPNHLVKALDNTKRAFPDLGRLLEDYYKIVKDITVRHGDRQDNWDSVKDEVFSLEKRYLEK